MTPPAAAPTPAPAGWHLRAAEDLRSLAWLHASERSAAVWMALHAHGFPGGLHLGHADHAGDTGDAARTDDAVGAMDAALTKLAHACVPRRRARLDDDLAADYAAIYLTHALRASPLESVWRDEDHLMLQGPTFAVRDAYRREGIPKAISVLPDDHLAQELHFVATLLERGRAAAARSFLDEHVLAWLPDFAARVSRRATTEVYAALAVLTAQACRDLRERLAHAPA